MTDLAVRIAYRGEGFSGSQIQPGLATVEGALLSSIERVTELPPEEINLRLASRTDKGVNATGNVAAFESGGADPVPLLKALNSIRSGVLCTAYARVDDDFLPRHADMRTYEYVMSSDGMDVGLAEQCMSLFRGEHDFSGFCKSEGKGTVIDLKEAGVREEEDVLILTFRADHFLWNMIRRIASTVSRVSSGRIDISRVEKGLEGGWSNFGLAPAEGLTLTDVFYEGVEFIPSPDPALMVRKREGLYRAHLSDRFYRSLRSDPRSEGAEHSGAPRWMTGGRDAPSSESIVLSNRSAITIGLNMSRMVSHLCDFRPPKGPVVTDCLR